MTGFVIVAVVLVIFLGFGIAMGVLMVSALSRRKAERYPESDDNRKLSPQLPRLPRPPEDDTPWYDR